MAKLPNITHLKQGNSYPDPIATAKVQGTHFTDASKHLSITTPLIANLRQMTWITPGASDQSTRRGYRTPTQGRAEASATNLCSFPLGGLVEAGCEPFADFQVKLIPVGVRRTAMSKQRDSRYDQTNFDSSRLVLRCRYCCLGLAGVANYVTSSAEFFRPDPGWPKGQK